MDVQVNKTLAGILEALQASPVLARPVCLSRGPGCRADTCSCCSSPPSALGCPLSEPNAQLCGHTHTPYTYTSRGPPRGGLCSSKLSLRMQGLHLLGRAAPTTQKRTRTRMHSGYAPCLWLHDRPLRVHWWVARARFLVFSSSSLPFLSSPFTRLGKERHGNCRSLPACWGHADSRPCSGDCLTVIPLSCYPFA